MIKDDLGREIEGFDKVAEVITTYYQELLGDQAIRREPVDVSIMQKGPGLTVEQQFQLLEPITEKEIRDVL